MKIKHLIGVFGVAAIALASCDSTSTADTSASSTTTPTSTTEVTSSTTESTPVTTTTTDTTTESTPVSTTTTETTTTSSSATRNKPTDLSTTSTLYIVGDSTVDDFITSDGSIKDKTYFYERMGWGGHITDYVENITVKNYGSSGRSSRDYPTYKETVALYTDLTTNIKKGDYLMIGFGHNDEKSNEPDRFGNANYSSIDAALSDSSSFAYTLYNNFIKVAEDAGATPILCTPICRLNANNDYSGQSGHITSTGDYRKAIVDLGAAKDVKVIDLTTYTKELYTKLGYDEAIYYHAITAGKSDTEPNLSTVDATHINNYGAKTFDYYIAEELYNDAECYLGNYVKDERTAPTKEKDLVKNSLYVYTPYDAPNLASYTPATQFTTTTEGWYGTAFGDTGGDPLSAGNGYYATETSSGVFKVGQSKSAATYFKGKIAGDKEGIAFAFKQISINDDFKFSCDAKVLLVNGDGKQDGFGIMLRDACWLPTNNAACLSNYIASSVYRESSSSIIVNHARESLTAIKKSGNTLSAYPEVGDTIKFSITRTGQTMITTTTIGDTVYTTNYSDFDLVAMDSQYFYLGMFGARGTVVEFSNLSYEKTGTSQGA